MKLPAYCLLALCAGALIACGPPQADAPKSTQNAPIVAPAATVAASPTATQAAAAAPNAPGADLPAPTLQVNGRTATITAPVRLAEGWMWVSATTLEQVAPFLFKGLDIQPGAGPGGSDLAVFTYEARAPGSTTLKLGLVPAGKMLVGQPGLVYTGPVASRFEAQVTAP